MVCMSFGSAVSVAFGANSCADHSIVVAFRTNRHFRGEVVLLKRLDQSESIVAGGCAFIAELECLVMCESARLNLPAMAAKTLTLPAFQHHTLHDARARNSIHSRQTESDNRKNG